MDEWGDEKGVSQVRWTEMLLTSVLYSPLNGVGVVTEEKSLFFILIFSSQPFIIGARDKGTHPIQSRFSTRLFSES